MYIEFESIPKILVQKWVIELSKHGYYTLIASRISKKCNKTISRQAIINALRIITKTSSALNEMILLESVQFCMEQGHILPDFVEIYLEERKIELIGLPN